MFKHPNGLQLNGQSAHPFREQYADPRQFANAPPGINTSQGLTKCLPPSPSPLPQSSSASGVCLSRARRIWPNSPPPGASCISLPGLATANLRTKILDVRGSDSSRILSVRGGILMSIGNLPESLSQAILAGIILVGRLGVGQGAWDKVSRATRIRGETDVMRCDVMRCSTSATAPAISIVSTTKLQLHYLLY